ncbi:MAG: lactonase family protein [Bacteroidales bacterium]|nr:lactonase family protein [Bacteroidales bacterium]
MKITNTIVWACGALAVILTCCIYFGLFTSEKSVMKINIGTYGDHIYRYALDTETMEFTLLEKTEAHNASYVIQCGSHIYAVSETGAESGVYSFGCADGLMQTAEKRQTGADPCFIMSYDGKILTADYSGGSVSVFPLVDGVIGDCIQQLQFTGSGPVEGRQESPHIHQLKPVHGTDMILASDLGSDVIRQLRFEDGVLVHVADLECPSGCGPRHMEFNDAGDRLYCICELSGEVLVYDVPAFKLLQRIQADEVNAGGSADIHMHPSGKYLYTSHRLDNDGISVFAVGENGLLEKIAYTRTGRHPRNFMITKDGSLLMVACMHDNLIQVFRIAEDGTLTLTDVVLRFDSDQPSCIMCQEDVI